MSETNAVARRPEAVGQLPPEIQAAIQFRKAQNLVASKLAALNWGKNVDEATRRCVADWCYRNDVDPVTELEVLGNKFYRNAQWHLRKLGELAQAGVVEYAVADHVNHDPRLVELAKDADSDLASRAKQEINRRMFLRIDYGIPDAATGAVCFRVKLRDLLKEVVGVAWCGGGTKSKVLSGGKVAASDEYDPIGTAEPAKTAESRAARRAVRIIADYRSDVAAQLTRGDDEAKQIEARIAEDHEEVKRPSALSGRAVASDGYERALAAPKPEQPELGDAFEPPPAA